jgi:two-component system nitrate/nitrite response regulator NarL
VPDQVATYGDGDGRRQTELSDRENEILGCLVSGHSNKTIARKLDIAEATVKVHVKGLLRKMQVSNRTQAAVRALKFTSSEYMPNNSID